MQKALDYLTSLGYRPDTFNPNGELHRFPHNGSKDAGWYIAWQNAKLKNGEFYYVVLFGDWISGSKHIFKPDGLPPVDKKAIDEQIKARQVRIEKEKKLKQCEAADKAAKIFKPSDDSILTSYMHRKMIPSLFGAGVYNDSLQVPTKDITGKIWGIQTILADGSKIFMKGQRVAGCFHIIGKIENSAYICEGFATGVSIHLATGKGVVVAFNAGNLVDVAKDVQDKYADTEFTICGDDDRKRKENPGREKAKKASIVTNGLLAFPIFPETDLESSDFNDLHVLYGLDKLREQLTAKPVERKTGFISLGYDEGTYFFYHIPSKDIVKATNFTNTQMYRLAPLEYWNSKYLTENGSPNLNLASHDLIQTATQIGPFNSMRIRGTGVWLDEGRVVINTGSSLILDGKEMSLASIKSWYVYVQTINRIPNLHPNPLSVEEAKQLVDVCCYGVNWKDKKSGILLAGWLAIARIAGVLPVRPHIWITGGKGSGKSTVMEMIVNNALGGPKGKVYPQGSSTEAGIRQSLKSDSLPIIFDEFETTAQNKEKIASIIELMRQSWSHTNGSILKGSASGSAVQYNLSFCACVASIRVSLDNDADKSRFSVLELALADVEGWPSLREEFLKITPEFGERLFARSAGKIPTILASYEVFYRIFAIKYGARFAQQNGMLTAAFFSIISDQVCTQIEARQLIESVNWTEEVRESKETDEYDCLNHLLSQRIRYDADKSIGEDTIGSIIQNNDSLPIKGLKAYGMLLDDGLLSIANKHSQLAKFYERTKWVDWKKSLARLPGAMPSNSAVNFSGVRSRAIIIPLQHLFK
jgi:putative DNA primase/helicase